MAPKLTPNIQRDPGDETEWSMAENAFVAKRPMTAEEVKAWKQEVEPGTITRQSTGLVPDSADLIAGASARGAKFDDGKADIALLFDYFHDALMAVAQVSEYGMRKYADSNSKGSGWQDVPNGLQRYESAGGRHTLKRRDEGEYDDGDSGLAHRAQKAWNSLAELALALRQGVCENRRGNNIEMVAGKPRPILGTSRKV